MFHIIQAFYFGQCDFILTECDFSLHGHGESWVLDLTAKQCIIVELWVQVPGEHGLYLHGAVHELSLHVVEVVEWAGAENPAWKLPAHHRLWDDLSSGTGTLLTQSSWSEAVVRTSLVQLHRLNVWLQVREGFLTLGVIELSANQWPAAFG